MTVILWSDLHWCHSLDSMLLQLPILLCATCHLQLRFLGDNGDEDSNVWSAREQDWKAFWTSQGGKEGVAKAGRVSTNGQ